MCCLTQVVMPNRWVRLKISNLRPKRRLYFREPDCEGQSSPVRSVMLLSLPFSGSLTTGATTLCRVVGMLGTALNALLLAHHINVTICCAILWGGQGHEPFQKQMKPQVPTER